jgi:hypothetical protein
MFAGIAFPGFFLTREYACGFSAVDRTDFLFSLVAALVLLVLATVSTPVVKDIYFLQVETSGSLSSYASTLRLGTLGYCLSGAAETALTAFTNSTLTNGCTAAKLGYTLDSDLFTDGEVLGLDLGGLSTSVVKALTYLLVLQPIGKSAICSPHRC